MGKLVSSNFKNFAFKGFLRNTKGIQLKLFQRSYKKTNDTYPSC